MELFSVEGTELENNNTKYDKDVTVPLLLVPNRIKISKNKVCKRRLHNPIIYHIFNEPFSPSKAINLALNWYRLLEALQSVASKFVEQSKDENKHHRHERRGKGWPKHLA